MKSSFITNMKEIIFTAKDRFICRQVRKERDIVYGGKALAKQIGYPLARPSFDWDIYSRTPRRSARRLEHTLDRASRGNYYYTRPAQHPGTTKVMYVGVDNQPKTRDDINIADFTRMPRRIRYKTINGIRYVTLERIEADKRRALRQRAYKFRHKKDRSDLNRIRFARRWVR